MKKRLAEKIMKRVKNNSLPKLHNYTSKQVIKAYYKIYKRLTWSDGFKYHLNNRFRTPDGKYKLPEA